MSACVCVLVYFASTQDCMYAYYVRTDVVYVKDTSLLCNFLPVGTPTTSTSKYVTVYLHTYLK